MTTVHRAVLAGHRLRLHYDPPGREPAWRTVDPAGREALASTALAIPTEAPDPDGWLRLEAAFQDLRHAEWALWQLGTEAEALAPAVLRAALRACASAVAARYEA